MRRKILQKLVLLAAVLTASPFALAQKEPPNQMALRLDVDKRMVQVGESLRVTIEFRRVGSGRVALIRQPSIATPELFDVRGNSSSTRVVMDGQQMVEISSTQLILSAARTGTEALGPAVLIYQDPASGPQELKSNTLTVTVVPKKGLGLFSKKPKDEPADAAPPDGTTPAPAPEDGGLMDIKPILTGLGWVLRALFWTVMLILGVWLVLRLFNRWRKRRREALPVKSESSRLREKYRRLSDEDLSGKEYCLAAAGLLRECLEFRHGFPATDRTAGEVTAALRKAGAPLEAVEKAEGCLGVCDKVLYADGALTAKERQNLKSVIGDFLPKG